MLQCLVLISSGSCLWVWCCKCVWHVNVLSLYVSRFPSWRAADAADDIILVVSLLIAALSPSLQRVSCISNAVVPFSAKDAQTLRLKWLQDLFKGQSVIVCLLECQPFVFSPRSKKNLPSMFLHHYLLVNLPQTKRMKRTSPKSFC